PARADLLAKHLHQLHPQGVGSLAAQLPHDQPPDVHDARSVEPESSGTRRAGQGAARGPAPSVRVVPIARPRRASPAPGNTIVDRKNAASVAYLSLQPCSNNSALASRPPEPVAHPIQDEN